MVIETLLIIFEQSCIHFPLIFAAYLSMSLLKTPDLSIESAFVFGALCAAQATLLLASAPLIVQFPLILLISLVGGMTVGLTSSTITRILHVPHLLSAIITFGIFHGVNQLITSYAISLNATANILTILPIIPRHPELLMLIGITFSMIVAGIFFCRTQLGYSLAAFGHNPLFFTHYAISTTYIFMSGIMISNACAGLSGYLFAQSGGFAEINMGLGKALFCISSLILGKQFVLTKKVISLWIPIVGVLFYFAIQQILLKCGFDFKFFTMIQAIIVLIILAYSYYGHTKREEIKQLGI